jgi:hypothetical protein
MQCKAFPQPPETARQLLGHFYLSGKADRAGDSDISPNTPLIWRQFGVTGMSTVAEYLAHKTLGPELYLFHPVDPFSASPAAARVITMARKRCHVL